METRNLRKTRQGVVISNKMDKTIVIASKFKEMHPIYGKRDLAPNFSQEKSNNNRGNGGNGGRKFRNKKNK